MCCCSTPGDFPGTPCFGSSQFALILWQVSNEALRLLIGFTHFIPPPAYVFFLQLPYTHSLTKSSHRARPSPYGDNQIVPRVRDDFRAPFQLKKSSNTSLSPCTGSACGPLEEERCRRGITIKEGHEIRPP